MTSPVYSGRPATAPWSLTADAPGAWPIPPSASSRPSTVAAVFWVAVAQVVCSLLGAGALATMLLAVDNHPREGMAAAALLLGVTVLVDMCWLGLAWMVRGGSQVARVTLAVLTAIGALVALAFCLVAWAVVVPLLGFVLQGAVLVLLFAPSTNAWFAGR
ncbi:hypothetical protein LQ327_19665 [Actinomycetospora endophytica]|uniref:Histidine kinase n=1 Tax=Actinomycetospora endophytica TaxID=2291215 RepID=A0ABS8PBD6_9PSEU|nr:hypothetical protein [Actinomycetospora endophytica]MCD2195591.1 hypothetical protein [Actinomycetospora endophytica]